MEICLFEPEIPQNTGTLARLSACLGLELNIIEPASFVMSEKNFRRAGMDYVETANIKIHRDFKTFKSMYNGRIILLDVKAKIPYTQFSFIETDCIMAGKESMGVPRDVFEMCDDVVVIPMKSNYRSLNVAVSVAMVIGEALRQCEKSSTNLSFI